MDGRMHYMLARRQFPTLTPTQIKRINGLMDNRQAQFLAFPQYDVMKIGKGHRKQKHDMLSACMIGSHVAGIEGMQAAMYHTMLDSMSTQLERTLGSENRDILMALWKKNMR
jgi:hypothetical protein